MSIGGTDIVLSAPRGEDVMAIILRACRRRWPNCLFQDANEADYHSLQESWVWSVGTTSKEFFIYRDEAARRLWEDKGAVPEDANTMLHFLIDTGPGEAAPAQVTLVCDQLDEEVRRLRDDLVEAFATKPAP